MERAPTMTSNGCRAWWVMMVGLACSCTPAKMPESQGSAEPAPPAPEQPAAAEVEPPFVYYRMTQAAPRELILDEVRLDSSSSLCFQAQQRLLGGIGFEPGQATLGDDARKRHEASIDAVVKAVADWRGRGQKPKLVLHAFAAHDEAADEQAAKELARMRGDAVRDWLIKRGVKAERLHVDAHGWELAAEPLRDDTGLRPMRTVEITSDRTPSSRAVRVAGPAPEQGVLEALQQRVRALHGQGTASEVSMHAPRVLIESRDANGLVTIHLDLAASSDEARALQRTFLQGMADGCTFAK